jgi:hypothetical protein
MTAILARTGRDCCESAGSSGRWLRTARNRLRETPSRAGFEIVVITFSSLWLSKSRYDRTSGRVQWKNSDGDEGQRLSFEATARNLRVIPL